MPLYRVAGGELVELRLGVVTAEGPDFGSGPVSTATRARVHEVSVRSFTVAPPPTNVRVHGFVLRGIATAPTETPTRARVHELTFRGIATTPPPVHARIHAAAVTGVPL